MAGSLAHGDADYTVQRSLQCSYPVTTSAPYYHGTFLDDVFRLGLSAIVVEGHIWMRALHF